MSLLARCPACGTTFRVQPAQLAVKSGNVRCGKCAAVFNGVSALVNEDAQAGSAEDAPTPSPATDAVPEFLDAVPPAPHAFLWGFAALLAVLALLGQALLHYRTELATQWPSTRPLLGAACEVLGCELRLPRNPEWMSIESSDLQPDRSRDNVVVLNAVVRNRAPFAQEFPALELTLTDEREYAVQRRVLQPADYLRYAGAERLGQGIAGGAEAVLRVHLEGAAAGAVGYRVYLFYP